MACVFAVSLMVGQTFYGLGDVLRVILGETVPGASFTVGELRLPRAAPGAARRGRFGMAGVTFQTMLRNPLASPDIIGISSGASAAAVVGDRHALARARPRSRCWRSAAALADRAVIYVLAYRDGVVGTRLILIGIGIAAMLDSVVAYVHRPRRDAGTCRRRCAGSPAASTAPPGTEVVPVVRRPPSCSARCCSARRRNLAVLQLGDDSAAALGVRVERTRLVVDPRRSRADRVRHRGDRPDRVRRVPVRADRGPHRRRRRLAAGARGSGRGAAGARRRPGRPVRLRHPLPGRRRHRRARARRTSSTCSSAPTAPEARCDRSPTRSPPSDVTLGYGDRTVVESPRPRGAARPDHRDRRRQRAAASRRCCGRMSRLLAPRPARSCSTARTCTGCRPRRWPAPSGCSRSRRSRRRASWSADLVARGRHPHQRLLVALDRRRTTPRLPRRWHSTDTAELADRAVDELSGGQRQRVWIAMALAQQTDILLLDEPTTFLDVSHQIDVLDLLTDLNRQRGTTIVMVLHDLNLAARYADHLVAVRGGRVHAAGDPDDVLTRRRPRRLRPRQPGGRRPGLRQAPGAAHRPPPPASLSPCPGPLQRLRRPPIAAPARWTRSSR